MKGSDIFSSIIIIIIFTLLILYNFLSVSIQNIQNNWPEYRCNPLVMPFASYFGYNTQQNFSYCIQTMQQNYMGFLTQPLNYNFNVLGNLGSNLTGNITDIRAMFSNIRGDLTSIIGNVFGVFLNILIEFQKIIISVKDLFGKLIGILASLMYTLEGTVMTMQSAWAGLPGGTVRAIGDISCFAGETKIMKKDGEIKEIKNIEIGDKLMNNEEVSGTLILNNEFNGKFKENLYEIYDKKLDQNIFVSGLHLIFDKNIKKFIYVKNYFKAKKSEKNYDKLYCLITTNHTIPIGNYIFHDWEDKN